MGTSVSIESFSFRYRDSDFDALKEITAQAEEGEFVVIMGHGGAGKSTLCRAMNGLVPRFFKGDIRGSLSVMGKEAARYAIHDMSRTVGLVFQDFEAQLFSTNLELEIAFGPENLQLPRDEIKGRIERYLSIVGLGNMNHRETSTLSGGQKQRLAIGAVLAMEPSVIVMDEPATDLDPEGKGHILSLASSLRDQKRTLIVVDTEPETAVTADRLWLMRAGEIVAQGTPEKILRDSKLLASCGVMTLPMISLFKKMGWSGNPITVEEALSLIEKNNLFLHRDSRGKPSPARQRGNPILEAKDIVYRYPGSAFDSLKGVNLTIYEGEFVAILGQNGSGKTTLAKHFNRLLTPTSGEMAVLGKATTAYKRHELARVVGYVFQNPDHQIFASTVGDEVAFGLAILGEDRRNIERQTAEALAVTGLTGYEARSPFLLSRGERQRVAVASILSIKPPVIILDEPTTGLDYGHQRDTMEMLKGLNALGHTIVIITHSMWVAESYAARTILMKDGAIIADGPTRDVFRDEARLAAVSLSPSPVVRLSNLLGTDALTVDQLARELR